MSSYVLGFQDIDKSHFMVVGLNWLLVTPVEDLQHCFVNTSAICNK